MKKIKFCINDFILILYLIITIITFSISQRVYSQIINPSFWLLFLIYLIYTNQHKRGRFFRIDEKIKTMLILTLLYLIIDFILGLVLGYTKNPYSRNLISFVKNFWQIILPIIGIEVSRSALANKNKKNRLYLVFLCIIFILLEINYSSFFSLSSKQDFFKYSCSILLPLIASNILYTYLCLKGSYKIVLIYRLIFEFTYLISPIIPNQDWFIVGIKGVLVPYIMYNFIKNSNEYNSRIKNRSFSRKDKIIYAVLISFIFVFLLFIIGVFKYKPLAIVSNSMNPVFYRGDTIVYRKVEKKELKKLKLYTIIVYDRKGQKIIHRIVDRYYKNGELYFITKGDANKSNDIDPVSKEQVLGVYNFQIKYIGYPSVWLNDLFNGKNSK